MKRITVIGAGNVGATVASVVAEKDIVNEVVLVDVREGVAEGKALDMWQMAPINHYNTRIIGTTNKYERTANSDIIVITSGMPRKPGMSRDDLIATNAKIVKNVVEQAIEYSPDAIIIVVVNPLDVMTYAAYKTAKKHSSKVFGMAGILDTARYRAFLADELDVSPNDIHALLLGGHGDTMVPLPRYTTVSGIPITEILPKERIDAIVERTKMGGGELVRLMGTSAWYAPGTAAAQMCEAVINDSNSIVPVCTLLDGEYDQKNVFLGVPVKLGAGGIKKIVELKLTEEEMALLDNSAQSVKKVMKVLDDMNLF